MSKKSTDDECNSRKLSNEEFVEKARDKSLTRDDFALFYAGIVLELLDENPQSEWVMNETLDACAHVFRDIEPWFYTRAKADIIVDELKNMVDIELQAIVMWGPDKLSEVNTEEAKLRRNYKHFIFLALSELLEKNPQPRWVAESLVIAAHKYEKDFGDYTASQPNAKEATDEFIASMLRFAMKLIKQDKEKVQKEKEEELRKKEMDEKTDKKQEQK